MSLTPIPQTINIELNGKLRKERKKRGIAVRSPKSPAVRYRRQLESITNSMRKDVGTMVFPLLKSLESQYVNDSYARELEQVFNTIRLKYDNLNKQAQTIADQFVMGVNTTNADRFYSALENSVGINMQSIIQNENIEDILIAKTRENVALIRSLPEEYFKSIESIVFTGTTQGSKAGSMIQQLRKAGKTTNNRAKLIARDQTTKLNSALNQQRQQNLGVEEYIWRTAEDERVRDSHRTKNGKVFRWDDPPKDTGHPGHGINCRCVATPILKL